ncbi:hypothetical protein [Candidatus Enterovibrio escicola]|uniref:hypothetical protein n=1 Tax=Candidatus Enterovibrio escicola TaxID=1927127 RepID=UPI00168175CE|nr:hypothetical protein [Candidatus Enterovibrio escacola]
MLGAHYITIMEQGSAAYRNGVPYSKNPHFDKESKAAWIEGWQIASFQERQYTTRTIH